MKILASQVGPFGLKQGVGALEDGFSSSPHIHASEGLPTWSYFLLVSPTILPVGERPTWLSICIWPPLKTSIDEKLVQH